MSNLVIESTHRESSLALRDYNGDGVSVSCGGDGVHARLQFYNHPSVRRFKWELEDSGECRMNLQLAR